MTSFAPDLTSFAPPPKQNMYLRIFMLKATALFLAIHAAAALIAPSPRVRVSAARAAIPAYPELWDTIVDHDADDTVSALWRWNDRDDLTAVATVARGRGRRESWRLKAWAFMGDAAHFALTASADDGLSAMISTPEAIHANAGQGADFRAFTRVSRGAVDAVKAFPLAVRQAPLVVDYAFQEDLIKCVPRSQSLCAPPLHFERSSKERAPLPSILNAARRSSHPFILSAFQKTAHPSILDAVRQIWRQNNF